MSMAAPDTELVRKWRLILGPEADPEQTNALDETDQRADKALSLLYDQTDNDVLRRSRVRLNEWLKDIRDLFPQNQTLFLQKEAIEKMGIGALLFEKETFESLTPDIELIRTILELKEQIPAGRMDDVHELVRRYAEEIEKEIQWALHNALSTTFEKGHPTVFPRKNEIDWKKTIKKNLRYYQPDIQTIIPRRRYGYERRKEGFPEIFLAVDSSGSMTESIIYSAIIASVLVHIKTIQTSLILFDHKVADLTDQLDNIVDLLFHLQLGGGTNIGGSLEYIHSKIQRPEESYVFLISDLYDNYGDEHVYQKMEVMTQERITVHCILTMDERGKVRFNKPLANALANLGIPCYSSSPDRFSEALKNALM